MEITDAPDVDAEGFIYFANEVLGFGERFLHTDQDGSPRNGIYWWQEDAVTPFDEASERLVQVTLCTPNESGKSSVVIPTLVLGWLYFYPQGRVVLTTADGKQLDNQVMPAIEAHRSKFPTWKFIERQVTTPSGGQFVAFTTDQAGRAEGWHKLDDVEGPLLMIVDEAKTVAEEIFTAIDRCGFNALLLTSSPGPMFGRFYESHADARLGFVRIKAGLADCPHIGREKIARLNAQHGPGASKPNPELLRSTLHGEFMLADGEVKFDYDGLQHLAAMAKAGHEKGTRGVLEPSRATGTVIFIPDKNGWLWLDDVPREGRSYLVFCDPNTCEQGEGTSERDNTACGVLCEGGIHDDGEETKDQVVAALYWPGGVKWDSDVLAKRMALLSRYYGRCTAVVEANNFGSALMKELQREGVTLWQRTKIDDINPNKQVKLLGFLSTERSRTHWVEKCATEIREQALVCRFQPAAAEFQTFIILPSGRAEAQQGCHDDWVAGIGIGLVVRCFSAIPRMRRPAQAMSASNFSFRPIPSGGSGHSNFGACG